MDLEWALPLIVLGCVLLLLLLLPWLGKGG
jgi:hypothetical protein